MPPSQPAESPPPPDEPVGQSPWRRWRQLPLLKCLITAAVAVVALAIVFYACLPTPQTRTVFSGRAERMSTIVDFADVASFRVGGMRALSDADEGTCVNGLLVPAHGVRVIYQRVNKDKLSIDLAFPAAGPTDTRAVAQITRPDGSIQALDGAHRLKIEPACEGEPPSRLAIHGNSDFGLEMSLAGAKRDFAIGYLYSGKIYTYVRSVDSFLSFGQPRLYRIQEAEVPAGARLRAETSAADDDPPVWWGLARVDPDQPGLWIDAATNSTDIVLILAGGTAGIEKFRIGDAGEITDDPNVVWFFAFLSVVLSVLVGFAGNLLAEFVPDSWKKWRPDKEQADREPEASREQASLDKAGS